MARDDTSGEQLVTDYRIVEAQTPEELERKVARLLDKGWQPLGAAIPCPSPQGIGSISVFYTQTMIIRGSN